MVPEGTVKWFDPNKGVGVITWENGQPDALVHACAIQVCCRARTLAAQDAVILDVIKDSDGIWAANIHRAQPPCPHSSAEPH
ncbi:MULTISPECIES: cold shock domain-containing protein [unclassified Streptomyces]|uniref:cold-shock protein n=1 Tax=unclassified Streptomyces TaxID=2593676 RepID=UPI0033CA2D06